MVSDLNPTIIAYIGWWHANRTTPNNSLITFKRAFSHPGLFNTGDDCPRPHLEKVCCPPYIPGYLHYCNLYIHGFYRRPEEAAPVHWGVIGHGDAHIVVAAIFLSEQFDFCYWPNMRDSPFYNGDHQYSGVHIQIRGCDNRSHLCGHTGLSPDGTHVVIYLCAFGVDSSGIL
jgi:hypothetical protein